MEKPIEQIPRNNPTKHNANSDLNIGEYVWKLPMVKHEYRGISLETVYG